MSDTTASTTPTPPTHADVQAIGTAAADAAQTASQQGASADEAGAAAAAAADTEAKSRNIHLPEAVIEQIAKASAAATVAELASQGALHERAPEPEPEPEGDGQEGEHGDSAPGAVTEDEKPHKRTAAEKFLSAYKR